MYCAACGAEIKPELNYCSRCGARVDKNAGESKSDALAYLSMATGFVGLGGLGLTIGLIAILLNYSVVPQVIVILSLAFLLAVFGITSLMIQQISRMTESNSGEKTLEKAKPVQFGAVNTAQLEEYRQPAMSITETTTRTLDKELVK
jgi:hypothetical protein